VKALLLSSALLSVGLSCGCSPALAWYGHTPDRTQRIEVQQRNKKQRLVIGDRKSAEYDGFATHAFVFASGGRHVAVAAMRIGNDGVARWHVVRDFHESAAWDALAGISFAREGRHLAYAAERKGRWRIVVDEQPGPPFDAREPDPRSWAPRSARWGYVAQDGPCKRVVIESQIGECYRRVIGFSVGRTRAQDMTLAVLSSGDSRVHFFIGEDEKANFVGARALYVDASGNRWAILAETEPPEVGFRMIVNGKDQPSFDEIGKFVWEPYQRSFGYTARRDKSWFVMEEDHSSRAYDAVEPPVFSGHGRSIDGRHVGHVGRAGSQGFVFVDGKIFWSDKYPVTALTFNTFGNRVAFMYRDAQSPVIAVDDARHRYDIVIDGSLRFSRDGHHWAALVGSLPE